MSDWRDKIREPNCTLCSLHEDAEHVCLMGDGTKHAKIMVVGEAPGAREDEEHRAFVGAAGKLLDEILREAGINRSECYITNAAKCRPPDNRTPTRTEVKTCSEEYLVREWQKVSPNFVLLLGNSALQAVLGKSGITKHRGTPIQMGKATVLPTFHPAAALRNPSYGGPLRADVQRFARMVRGEAAKAPPTRVRIIRNVAQFKWLRRQLMQADLISFDIETTGLDEQEEGSRIVSIGFSWEEGQAAVLPLWHSQSKWTRRAYDTLLRALKPTLERKDAKYIAHNGKFDCRWLAHFGIYVNLTFDTMLAAHMLEENRAKGLKPLSQILLGADAYDIGEDVRDAYNAPLKRLCIYNGKDTDYTLRLYHLFKSQLKQEPRIARVFTKLMMPASNALTQVERIGLWVDGERLKKMKRKAVVSQAEARSKLLEYVPRSKRDSINFNSPQQLAKWLFEDLSLDPIEETKTGAFSTKESVLLQLAKRHPAPAYLLSYRKWTKYLNTYLEPWDERRDHRSRIHTNYKLFGTVTGRLSSEKPNLQQVPREGIMRTCFGAPPGWKFVEADYSQIELRIAAWLANEKNLIRAFINGEDNHLNRAVRITGKRPEDITKEERKKAKAVNFGFLYSMGAKKFVSYARDNYDVEVPLAEAEKIRKQYFKDYPALPRWHDRQRRLAHRYQRVTSPLGRVRHLPDVLSRDREVQAEAERQAINSPVQSCASDLMLMSLVRLHSILKPSEARIVGTVHDALLFEVREDVLEEILPLIKEVMEDMDYVKRKFGAIVTVPIEAEIKVSQHWGDKDAEIWTPE